MEQVSILKINPIFKIFFLTRKMLELQLSGIFMPQHMANMRAMV